MQVEIIDDLTAIWSVDWALVRRIVYSYWHHRSIMEHGRVNRESQRTWNPFSWAMPDLVSFEVDWKRAREARDAGTEALVDEFAWLAGEGNVREVRSRLRHLIDQTEFYREDYRLKVRQASKEMAANIERSVSQYDNAIAVSRFIRDRSADTVLIGATFLSGGTALAVAGGGSVLKGSYSYQDKGNAGLAVVEATTSFITTAIPIAQAGRGAAELAKRSVGEKVAEEGVIVFIEVSFDSMKGLMDGETGAEALTKAVSKAAANKALGAVIGADRVRNLLQKVPVPATVKVGQGAAEIPAVDLMEKLGGNLAGAVIADPIANAAGNFVRTGRQTQRSHLSRQDQGVLCEAGAQLCARYEALELAIQQIGTSAGTVPDAVCGW